MGVLVICVLVFVAFCIVCTAFLYCFVYVHLLLFVLVYGLLPQRDNSLAVNNNNNNNNNNNTILRQLRPILISPPQGPFRKVYFNGMGYAVAQLVGALPYKPEGHRFVGVFHSHNPSGITMTTG